MHWTYFSCFSKSTLPYSTLLLLVPGGWLVEHWTSLPLAFCLSSANGEHGQAVGDWEEAEVFLSLDIPVGAMSCMHCLTEGHNSCQMARAFLHRQPFLSSSSSNCSLLLLLQGLGAVMLPALLLLPPLGCSGLLCSFPTFCSHLCQ